MRLLVVDSGGVPRSPSAEVADRGGALSGPAVVRAEQGYVVSWGEGESRFERIVDGRGRPLGDVTASSTAQPAPSVDGCTRGTKLVCATPRGPLEIPPDEQALSRAESGATVSLGASGLRLWLLDCN